MTFTPGNMPVQSRGKGCAKAAGFGCLGLVGLAILLPTLAFGGGSWLIVPIIIGLVIWMVVRSVRKWSGGKATAATAALSESQLGAADPVTTLPSTVGLKSPICEHYFTEEQLSGSKTLKCDCGYNLKPADLRKFQQVEMQLAQLSEERSHLLQAMRDTFKSPASAAKTAQSATTPKPAKPKATRPKIALSPQQWLVIGASILVFVAGMIFVSSNVNRLPQWVFELITVGLAVGTGFGSVLFRKTSALLASFFTAFSAAMQLATFAIIGDQLNTSFEWNTMPAWWWLVSLTGIGVIASVLAKFTSIFGWKAISQLSAVSASLVLDLGVLADSVAPTSATVHISVLTVTAVGLICLTKWLRSIAPIEVTDKALKAYAKELVAREDSSLRWFAVVGAALQLTAGLGLFLAQYLLYSREPLDSPPLVLLAAVWLGVGWSADRWSGQLRASGVAVAEFSAIARFTGHVGLGLAVVSVGTFSSDAWLAALVTLALAVAVNQGSGYFKPLAPTPFTSLAGLGSVALGWLLWQVPDLVVSQHGEVAAAFYLGIVAALALSEWRLRVDKFSWVTTVGAGLATLVLAFETGKDFAFETTWVYALESALLAVTASLFLPLRHWLASRAGSRVSGVLQWVALAGSIAVVLARLFIIYPGRSHVGLVELLPSAVVFLGYAAVAVALLHFTKWGSQNATWLRSHSYMGQFVVLFACGQVFNYQPDYSAIALLLIALAALNYTDAWFARQTVGAQLGFAAALASLLTFQAIDTGLGFIPLVLLVIAAVTGLGLAHENALLRRLRTSGGFARTSALIGIVLTLLLSYVTQWPKWNHATLGELFAVQALLWLVALSASSWNWRRAVGGLTVQASVWWMSLIYVGFAWFLLLITPQEPDLTLLRWRAVLSSAMVGVIAIWNHRSHRRWWLIPFAYLGNMTAGLVLGQITGEQFVSGGSPEPYTLWIAAAVVATTAALGSATGWLRKRLMLDIPVLFVAVTTLIYSFSVSDSSDGALVRKLLAFAVIAGFAFWRSGTEEPMGWLFLGYLGALGFAHFLAVAGIHWSGWDYRGPEPHSVLYALAVALGNWFVVRRLGERLAETRVILMLAVLTLPTLYFSAIGGTLVESRIRQVLALAAIGAVALWRIAKGKPLPWMAPGYLGSIGAALALGTLLQEQLWPDFVGPELLSIPAVAALLLAHRVCLPKLNLNSSWLAWGVPMGLALLPSAFATATLANVAFEDLTAAQITRVLVVLAASVLLLVFGVRLGNLANTTVGLAGLTLLLVPNTAFHSDAVVAGTAVESTALVLGALVFIALGILKRAGVMRGRSTVFIGIPLAIVIGPALVRALGVLGNPQLSGVDWWRFSILLAAGLTLLIVGALRELGGMFFPGLASVLLTALPYAFMKTKDQEWFLWVVLLLVAGVMVWVALRLEKLRKAGRNSANWLRELK